MADPSGRGRRGRRARRASPPGPATDRGGDGTGGECAAVSFLKNDSKHELALRSGEGRLPERRARSAGCVFGENHLDPYFLPSVKINFRWMTGPNATTKTLSEGNARARPAGRAEADRLDGAQPGRGATRAGPPSRASGYRGQHRGRLHDSPGWGCPRRRKKRRRDGKCSSEFAGREPRPAPSLPGGRVGDAPHQKTDGLKKKKHKKC